MFNVIQKSRTDRSNITIVDGTMRVNIPIKNITCLQAEHVYVRIIMTNGEELLHRSSLSALLKRLPSNSFLQVHRSYVVNTNYVVSWSKDEVFMNRLKVPISRNRKGPVNDYLAQNYGC